MDEWSFHVAHGLIRFQEESSTNKKLYYNKLLYLQARAIAAKQLVPTLGLYLHFV